MAAVGAAAGARWSIGAVKEIPETVRVAIIGLEGHYSEVTSATKILPQIKLVAVADTRPEVLRKAEQSSSLGKPRGWSNYREMLVKEKLDVVCVCGENGGRAEILQECAQRGLAILSEKPIALTMGELGRVKKIVERKRTPFTALLQMRGFPVYRAMRDIVLNGDIGEVALMDAQKSYKAESRPEWMKSRKTYGGTIPFIGIHMIDLMRWVSGRDMVEAAAFHANVGAPDIGEMENSCSVIFRLDNRGTASLRMDYQRPDAATSHGDDRLRVVGTRGIVEYEGTKGLTLVTDSKPVRQITELPPARNLCVDLVEAMYLGKPLLIPTRELFRVSEIVLKARAAADENRVVRL